MDELRLALRRLIKRPASTIASLTTLAFAIGAAAVTWSALSAVLIHPLPVSDPEQVLVAGERRTRANQTTLRTGFIYPTYQRIRESGIFERPVAQWGSPHTLLVTASQAPQRADVGFATHDFFDVLGIRIAAGRGFTAEEDGRGASPVAVLSHRYWRRVFDSSRSVIGDSILVAGKQVTVIGVMQQGFRGLDLSESIDLYLPFHTLAEIGGGDTNYFAETGARSSPTAGTMILGRLRPGVSLAEATSRLAASVETGSSRPAVAPPPVVLVPVNTVAVPELARAGMTRFAGLLAITVGLLLFIGCGTVGMLLLIRTEARSEEFAMCMALGASRARLARGIVFEGALLAVAGAAFAAPVAGGLFRLIQRFELPGYVSIELLELTLDGTVVAVAIGAAAAAILLISLIAGLFGFRARVADAVRSRAGATVRTSRRATRSSLVAAQVAVAVLLVAGAGLFARSVVAALNLNPEMGMARIVMGTIPLGSYGYSPDRAAEFFGHLQKRLNGNPAIKSMAFSMDAGGMSAFGKIAVDGVSRQFPSTVWYRAVDPDYFRTMGLRLLEGRDFTADDRPATPPVAVVSKSLARLLARDAASALDRRVDGLSSTIPPVRVVGVVSDVVARINVLEPLAIYLPVAQSPSATYRDIAVRTASSADDARREILAAVKEIDPLVMPTPLRTLEARVIEQMAPQQFGATVLGALGLLAVLLTLLGVYVLTDSMASMRMREMGIRAALGATRRQLGSIAIAETGRLVGVGLIGGLGLTWLGANSLRAFLFQVQPLDPLTLGMVAALILALALAVSVRSALRMARVDLAAVLKSQ